MDPRPKSLPEALDLAGWGPRDLARAVNAWLERHERGAERIDVTAAYPWLRSGYCPHGSIPAVVATVLSERLRTVVSADTLWPGHGRARRSTALSSNLARMTTLDDIVRGLSALTDGAQPLPSTGAELVAAALEGLHAAVHPALVETRRDRVMLPQAELIATHVSALRRLDDQQGGGALSLRYVVHELANVLDLLRSACYDPETGRELHTIVADLAQLAGWMHFHAGQTSVAQPYLVMAVRLARAVHDQGRVINNLGLLAYTATSAEHSSAAVQIVNVARQLSTPSALVRARTAGRAATAYAAVGDAFAFQAAVDHAQDLLGAAEGDDAATYLYYLNADQLAAEAGHGLLTLASRSELRQRQLLIRAVDLLRPLSGSGARPGYERSALLHGCHLARAQLLLRDLDGAVEATRTALTRLPDVQSRLCLEMLRTIRADLAKRSRSVVVADFLPELDDALARA